MMRRRFSAQAAVGLALLLLAAAPPLRAATRSASAADVRADLTRLQGLVSACQTSAKTCDPTAVGDDLIIGDSTDGSYDLHWDWLRSALTTSKTAKDADRTKLLADCSAQLTRIAAELEAPPPATTDQFKRAQSNAATILARPEFQYKDEETWWDRAKARFWGWVFKVFAGLALVGAAAPWLAPFLIWTCCILVVVGVLIFLLRTFNRQRMRISMAGEPLANTHWDREATDWARLAEAHAAAGEWRDAVHCLYWAAIVSLESRRAWRHNPTRTPREYVRLLQPGSPQQHGLRGLTRIFERVWYGLRDARPEEYTEARGLYESLASGAATPQGNATGAVAQGGAA